MNSQPQKLKLYINMEVSRFIHDSKKSLKTHLISNNTYCNIYQRHLFVHLYVYAQMGPLINKNKHFSHSLHLNKSGTKYTWSHIHIFIYIYINVNTGKQIEVNTFNLFIFFNPCFICKVNDHLGKSLLLVIIHIFNFKQNWIKPMHKDGGFFLVKEMFSQHII